MTWITVLVLAACAVGIVEPKTSFRWCAISDKEMKKCNDFMKIIPKMINQTTVSGIVDTGCVQGTTAEDCMKKIKEDKADLITLDSGKVYTAGKTYELVPIAAELTGDSLGYYAVAVAKKETNITLETLKGRKTCHTGYGRTSGWNLPIGHLLKNQDGFRTGCGDNIPVKSASKYFKESCVPGVPDGYSNLCALCPDKKCTTTGNKYAGYTGAFNCMKDGKGEVAFVKHLTTAEVVGQDTSGYKYLCSGGTTQVVNSTSHMNCNFGQSKSHTVVTRKGDNTDIIKILVQAGKVCNPTNTTQKCGGFIIFSSTKWGSAGDNLLFKDKATALQDVGDKKTYETWLGKYAVEIEALNKKGAACPTKPGVTGTAGIIFAAPGLVAAMFALPKTLL